MNRKDQGLVIFARKVRLIPVVLILLVLSSMAPVQLAWGQEPNPHDVDYRNLNVIVSNDGLEFTAGDFSAQMFTESFEGVGNVADLTFTAGQEFVSTLKGGIGPSSVIGEDGRTQIEDTTSYPYSALAYLVVTYPDGTSGTCTGWFIGARVVATAGHCVYFDRYGGWATSITAYPGRNGDSIPYGSATSHRLFSVNGWTQFEFVEYDYGAIQLDSPLGDTVGWFGFRWDYRWAFQDLSVTITGYPGDKPEATMWGMTDLLKRTWMRRMFYEIDTAGGQSGAPVYHSYSTECDPCSVAVHAYGVGSDPFGQYNSGTRITSGVFNNLVEWKDYPYP